MMNWSRGMYHLHHTGTVFVTHLVIAFQDSETKKNGALTMKINVIITLCFLRTGKIKTIQ